jgi:hypothetical protein
MDSAEKPVEIIGDFPFMLRPVEAFIGFFSRRFHVVFTK